MTDIMLPRVSSGVEGFDRVVGGGLLRGSTTVVAGPAGSGKTTFGLQFALAGSKWSLIPSAISPDHRAIRIGSTTTFTLCFNICH